MKKNQYVTVKNNGVTSFEVHEYRGGEDILKYLKILLEIYFFLCCNKNMKDKNTGKRERMERKGEKVLNGSLSLVFMSTPPNERLNAINAILTRLIIGLILILSSLSN